jgi:hypothetical protein
MGAALRDLEALMEGEAHNKVLAIQLLLGQRARASRAEDPGKWPRHGRVRKAKRRGRYVWTN